MNRDRTSGDQACIRLINEGMLNEARKMKSGYVPGKSHIRIGRWNMEECMSMKDIAGKEKHSIDGYGPEVVGHNNVGQTKEEFEKDIAE